MVTLVDAKQGQQEARRWNATEVIENIAWLKRMNARGFDVWIRPDGNHGLVLLDGLNQAGLQMLHELGFAPSAVVRSGAEQFQAWVKLAEQPVGETLRGQAGIGLAAALERYGAQAVSRSDGRLAGFTNQQAQRADGRHPYMLMAEGDGKVAPAGSSYLGGLQQMLERATELTREIQHHSSGPER